MSIPGLADSTCWAELCPEEKRTRVLRASGQVFARDGLDAPMPAIAAAAGAGIGSLYRQFPSKRDLLAALVSHRLEEVADMARDALAAPGGPWSALTGLLWALAERQANDRVLGEAMVTVSDHPDVQGALAGATAALERLLAAARDGGRLRQDATTRDVRLLMAATRAAAQLEPDAWRRMIELGVDALEATTCR